MDEDQKQTGESPEDKLLREIREDYTYFRDYWRENHEEAKVDLRYVSGDPWESDERRAREDNGRPVLCPDELEQYLNATINNLRQNKRAIKVNPAGASAQDKDADTRSAIIRGIEYKSNAQAAYTNAFEGAINCGFGFFRISTKQAGKNGEVEPCIKIIENPLSVMMDPNAKEADFSDQRTCFVMDVMRQSSFSEKYPNAKKTSFTAEDQTIAPGWFQGENIVVAEYWRASVQADDWSKAEVTQYITNGIEILEETEWPGTRIPIISVTGKKMYVPRGGEMARMFYSMIRKARGPQMMLAYIASQEAEEYGMAPRAPMVGYVGQFNTDKEAWDNANKVPRAYLMIDPVVDQTGNQVLPLPTRVPFVPNAQAYEIGFERWRRSIQSAMGITPLPTPAQQQNEKSGVALERIQTQQAIGAYHFTDNFDRSLENAGRQLDELITKVMDTPRHVATRQPDDEHALLAVAPGGQMPEDAAEDAEPFDPTQGDFDVTISTGPSYQSQREEASAFVDLLVQEIDQLPIAPQGKASLLATAVKLKNLGPIGDEISKILDPQGDGEPIPPQAQQMIAQLQQQLQQAHMMGQGLYQKVQELEFDRKAGVVKAQNDYALEKLKIEAQVTTAEINTKAQQLDERVTFVHDLVKQLIGQRHELGMGAAEAQQEQQMAQQQAQAQSAQSAQDAGQQQAMQSQGGAGNE